MDILILQIFSGADAAGLASGAYLFHTSDRVCFVHLIDAGTVSLERVDAGGQVTCLQRATDGEILAEASVYERHYHCDARALTDLRLRRVPLAEFTRRLADDPERASAWAAHLARTVQKTRLIAEIRSFRTVAQRLDAWLGEYGALPARGQWQSLARELAVSHEALYRELATRKAAADRS